MKKTILFVFALLITSNVFAANDLPATSDPVMKEKADKQMKLQNRNIINAVKDELRKKLPQRINKVTVLTDVTSNDLELIYTHEIDIGLKSTKTVRNEDNSTMKEAITYGVCTRAKKFLDSKIVLTYLYNNAKTKEELFKYEITPKSCEEIWAGFKN